MDELTKFIHPDTPLKIIFEVDGNEGVISSLALELLRQIHPDHHKNPVTTSPRNMLQFQPEPVLSQRNPNFAPNFTPKGFGSCGHGVSSLSPQIDDLRCSGINLV